jgi:uridine phosphorylase
LIPCVVGASYAVLVAEQLFASGCKLLISVTSAGNIAENTTSKRFALITEAIRDEGTSYHYLPAEQPAVLSASILQQIRSKSKDPDTPFFEAKSWTTDAPYRETQSAIDAMKNEEVVCVEMEASALYAFAEKLQKEVICFAHLTNNMAREEGDFEKGEEFGSLETIELISRILLVCHL